MASELQLFVKEALMHGATRTAIREKLSSAGWTEDDIRNALESFAEMDFVVPVPKRKPYLSAREAFRYLVMFLTLYISSFSFGTLLFQFINRWIPDPLQVRYGYEYQANISAIRSATAALIIAFPIFFFMSWLLHKAMRRDPEKRSSKIRKWLTYITLFIAAGVVIGDLITLVYNVLSGELTTRFILKVLTILTIAVTIFGYYLWDLRREEKES